MHLHRSSALGYASAASAAHSRVYGACAAEAAASESSGLSVGGCIRACRDFIDRTPYPPLYQSTHRFRIRYFRSPTRERRDRVPGNRKTTARRVWLWVEITVCEKGLGVKTNEQRADQGVSRCPHRSRCASVCPYVTCVTPPLLTPRSLVPVPWPLPPQMRLTQMRPPSSASKAARTSLGSRLASGSSARASS